MNTKFHGVTSLILIGIAITIAAYTAAVVHLLVMFGYIAFSTLSFVTIITVYCAKCACKTHCPHVIPGFFAKNINRQTGPYHKLELIALLIALVIVLLLPNIWMWHFPVAMGIYWIFAGIAVIEIRRYICKPCGHIQCPLNNNKSHLQ